MKYKTVIRYILTAALLYGVYTETGPWTLGAFALIAITVESVVLIIGRKLGSLRDLYAAVDRLSDELEEELVNLRERNHG